MDLFFRAIGWWKGRGMGVGVRRGGWKDSFNVVVQTRCRKVWMNIITIELSPNIVYIMLDWVYMVESPSLPRLQLTSLSLTKVTHKHADTQGTLLVYFRISKGVPTCETLKPKNFTLVSKPGLIWNTTVGDPSRRDAKLRTPVSRVTEHWIGIKSSFRCQIFNVGVKLTNDDVIVARRGVRYCEIDWTRREVDGACERVD